MKLTALLLLAGIAGTPAAAVQSADKEVVKKERLICKRTQASESRLASKRVCRTAADWRTQQTGEGDGALQRAMSGKGN